jgi:hypothetical protein
LENRKIKKPKSNEYHGSKDFYIGIFIWLGAELVFYQHHFKIVDADDYAKKFMETNPELFPQQKVL